MIIYTYDKPGYTLYDRADLAGTEYFTEFAATEKTVYLKSNLPGSHECIDAKYTDENARLFNRGYMENLENLYTLDYIAVNGWNEIRVDFPREIGFSCYQNGKFCVNAHVQDGLRAGYYIGNTPEHMGNAGRKRVYKTLLEALKRADIKARDEIAAEKRATWEYGMNGKFDYSKCPETPIGYAGGQSDRFDVTLRYDRQLSPEEVEKFDLFDDLDIDEKDPFLEKLKDYYTRVYYSDDEGDLMNDDSDFYDLFDALENRIDIYSVIGKFCDSIVRERLFQRLAKIMHVDYGYVYDEWIGKSYRDDPIVAYD